ncbi:defensin-like protein 287 [Raphanus sativus]|uniref:Defensin-like protein 287 n=1 Tax=Raphanus sativus TaxID=3726 RepID=A0A9W3C0F4_RAPSA|nr:defensin-like protein 287 [Raphanus sativus]
MNNLLITVSLLLVTIVFAATFTNPAVEAKKEIIISFKCKQKSDCLSNIACLACVDCRCDKNLCRCHGFKEENGNPTVAPLPV